MSKQITTFADLGRVIGEWFISPAGQAWLKEIAENLQRIEQQKVGKGKRSEV